MSRWMMPIWCAKATPLQTCTNQLSWRATLMRPDRMMVRSERPPNSAMTRQGAPSMAPTSNTGTMLGCPSRAQIIASRKKRGRWRA